MRRLMCRVTLNHEVKTEKKYVTSYLLNDDYCLNLLNVCFLHVFPNVVAMGVVCVVIYMKKSP